MGDSVEVCSGKDYKHLKSGDIPVYGTGGYMLSVNEALSYNQDAIGIGRKGTIDKPYVLKAPFWTVDTLFYAIPKKNNDLPFIFSVFQKVDWKRKDESTGVPSLSKNTINDVDIIIPVLEEQSKIGSIFTSLDNLITLHQRKEKSLILNFYRQNLVLQTLVLICLYSRLYSIKTNIHHPLNIHQIMQQQNTCTMTNTFHQK